MMSQVGKKVVPILELPHTGEVMKESMDSESAYSLANPCDLTHNLDAVVKRIDEDPAFGPPILKPSR